MFMYLLMLAIVMGLPLSSFAQFIDKGDYVEVKKTTKLCSNVQRGSNHPHREFWMVTSIMRSNRTQTVEGFVQEETYDPESGETGLSVRRSGDNYAIFFKRDPEHKGMLLMINPEHGRVEATVRVCGKKEVVAKP
jgi:hypothetical protein